MVQIMMHDKQMLRNRIAELEREVESLKAQLTTALANTGEAKANARLTKEFADYKAWVERLHDEFAADCQRIHDKHVAECAKLGIEL
jgi:phage shock protein A